MIDGTGIKKVTSISCLKEVWTLLGTPLEEPPASYRTLMSKMSPILQTHISRVVL